MPQASRQAIQESSARAASRDGASSRRLKRSRSSRRTPTRSSTRPSRCTSVSGVDPKKSDQNVRGTVLLPHGTGKTMRVIVFAKGDNAKEAQEAGADVVGDQDLIDRIKGGLTEFDVAVATPDMMGAVGTGTGQHPRAEDAEPEGRHGDAQHRRRRFATSRPVRSSSVSTRAASSTRIVGKASFDEEQLLENVTTLLDAIVRAKPASAKGTYLKSITLATTMGPGVRVDPTRLKDRRLTKDNQQRAPLASGRIR